ncbi:hypothetical protein CC80DRAFT_560443, partial [Byssothecium circinans]
SASLHLSLSTIKLHNLFLSLNIYYYRGIAPVTTTSSLHHINMVTTRNNAYSSTIPTAATGAGAGTRKSATTSKAAIKSQPKKNNNNKNKTAPAPLAPAPTGGIRKSASLAQRSGPAAASQRSFSTLSPTPFILPNTRIRDRQRSPNSDVPTTGTLLSDTAIAPAHRHRLLNRSPSPGPSFPLSGDPFAPGTRFAAADSYANMPVNPADGEWAFAMMHELAQSRLGWRAVRRLAVEARNMMSMMAWFLGAGGRIDRGCG